MSQNRTPLPEILMYDWQVVSTTASYILKRDIQEWLAKHLNAVGVEVLLYHPIVYRHESVLTIGELSQQKEQYSHEDKQGKQFRIVVYGAVNSETVTSLTEVIKTRIELLASMYHPLLCERLLDETPVISYQALELDGRWVLVNANKALAAFTGKPVQDFIGAGATRVLTDFIHPDDLSQLVSSYDFARSVTRELTLAYRLRNAVGEYIPVVERLKYSEKIDIRSCSSVIWPQAWDKKSADDAHQVMEQVHNFVQDINFETGHRFLEHFARRLSINPAIQSAAIVARMDNGAWETRVIERESLPIAFFTFFESDAIDLNSTQYNQINRFTLEQPEYQLIGDSPYYAVFPLQNEKEDIAATLILSSHQLIGDDDHLRIRETILKMVRLFAPRILKEIRQLRIAEAQVEQNNRLAEQKNQLTGMVYMLGQLDTVDSEDDFIRNTEMYLNKIFQIRQVDWVYWSSEGWWLADVHNESSLRWFDSSTLLNLTCWQVKLESARYSGQIIVDRSNLRIYWPIGSSEAGYLVMIIRIKKELPDLDLLSFCHNALALALSGLQQRENLRHQAMRDSLTGLGNRVQLHAWMRTALPVQTRASLLLFDLNRFKEINDSFGHQFGDKLLQQIGPRISESLVNREHYLARLGGDEFALFFPNISSFMAMDIAEKVHQKLADAYLIDGLRFQVEASVGVAHFPEHGSDGHELLRCADVAMYEAKSSNRRVVEFHAELDNNTPLRIAVLSELDRALEEQQLWVAYQPLMQTKTGQVAGVEALIRWQHPNFGALSPGEFIPIAEMGEGIRKITEFVLRHTCENLTRWRKIVPKLHAAVNISPQVLLNHQFPLLMDDYLSEYNLPGEAIVLELTESTLLVDPVRGVEIIQSLGELGVQVEIDDFGTGYSSLSYLKSLPISALKIDRSFVSDILKEPQNEVIVSSTVQMAHSLGLKIVAEGVEDEATLMKMMRLDCDMIQGYYYAKPIPSDEVSDWLERNR